MTKRSINKFYKKLKPYGIFIELAVFVGVYCLFSTFSDYYLNNIK